MINWEVLYNRLIKNKAVAAGEGHHIIPKHDNGKDKDGIVTLERRYHILAHYIRFRWKKQVGDRVAYQMMLGQLTNPMHDQKLLEEHRVYMRSEERRAIAKDRALSSWSDSNIRSKRVASRKGYISNLDEPAIVTQHLNTAEGKLKCKLARKLYYKNRGGIYKVEGFGEVRWFDLKMDLVKELKIDPTTVDKYVNTGIEIKKGALKGYKIFNII